MISFVLNVCFGLVVAAVARTPVGQNENSVYSFSDPCPRLCDEFSATNRGNGFDLCENDITSVCIFEGNSTQEICAYLYWSLTDDNQAGLIFDTGDNVTNLRSVSCFEAERILSGNLQGASSMVRLEPYNLTSWSSSLYAAVHVFIHLPFVQQAMNRVHRRPILSLLHNYTIQLGRQFGYGSFSVPSMDPIRQHLGDVHASQGDNFLSVFNQLVLETGNGIDVFLSFFVHESICENCGSEFMVRFLGPILLPNVNETLSVQEILDSRFLNPVAHGIVENCPFCGSSTRFVGRRIDRWGRYLMFHFEEPQHVLLSTTLYNEGFYQLLAIVHKISDHHYETDIKINGLWFRANQTTMVPIEIHDMVELARVSTLVYSAVLF